MSARPDIDGYVGSKSRYRRVSRERPGDSISGGDSFRGIGRSGQTEQDARALLTAASARIQGTPSPWPDAPAHQDVVALLDWAASDPASGEVVRELVTRVPASRQLALGELVADPLLLGALVTLLQTRFRIRTTSKDGKRSYDVEIGKEAADASVIGDVISRVLVKRP